MQRTLFDLIRLALPLSKKKKGHLSFFSSVLSPEELARLRYYLKLNLVGVSYHTFGITRFVKEQAYPQAFPSQPDKEISEHTDAWNKKAQQKARMVAFESFSLNAQDIIPSLIAPNIVGFDEVKRAAAWQLLCPERIHILLLGDPGTGKTDILRSTANLSPISSFGLGSGTSGVGLVGTTKGKVFIKGLLPQAHKGLCCIDELNLLKPTDRGALLNAMEKGFVTYNKGSTNKSIPAQVRVLATANPKGDRFIGQQVSFLKKQLPFDPALLSRFHLIFLVRRPDVQAFLKIAKSIVNDEKTRVLKDEEQTFIREYIEYASSIDVSFNKKLEPVITDFFEDLKRSEDQYLIEISPRLVVGVIRMAKAVARMSLRNSVTHQDLSVVLSTLLKSVRITPDARSKNN